MDRQTLTKAILLMAAHTALVCALENGLARKPPMGWSTFNQWGGAWTETTVRLAADSIVSTGLKECGYEYVNVDGHNDAEPLWPGGSRFVAFAKPTAEYVHSKGLKFGVYMTMTTNPQTSANHLLEAKVDFLKHDQWSYDGLTDFIKMRDAIKATGRPIVYSCHKGPGGVGKQLPDSICNMFRTGRDIFPSWDVVMEVYDQNFSYMNASKAGYWSDPDMMEVGCRPFNKTILLTPEESRAHFSMWCMMAAPLIMGFDVTRTHILNAAPLAEYVQTIEVLSNTELIAVDQDALCKSGRRIKGQGALEVWIKDLSDGTKAVAFFNRTASAANMTISAAELGWASSPQIYVRDLWAHQNVQPFATSFTRNVGSHVAEVYKMSTSGIPTPIGDLNKMEKSARWLEQFGRQVMPRTTAMTVVSGTNSAFRSFDARGRMAIADPRAAGASVLFLRSVEGRGVPGKIVLTGGQH